MKYISYALFGSGVVPPENMFEFNAYMRGLYWNVRMNKLLYPDWITHVSVDSKTFSDYDNIFNGLIDNYGMALSVHEQWPLCKSMLGRLQPAFIPGAEYLICRDADALSTYREAQAVQEWINSGLDIHSITDNPAHGIPLMGGLSGFKASVITERFNSIHQIFAQARNQNWERGSDQVLQNDLFYNEPYKKKMFGHYLQGFKGTNEAIIKTTVDDIPLWNVDPKLWESNLCVRHMGSAGVVDLEVIRFFKRFDTETQFESIAKRYPKIMYWYAT